MIAVGLRARPLAFFAPHLLLSLLVYALAALAPVYALPGALGILALLVAIPWWCRWFGGRLGWSPRCTFALGPGIPLAAFCLVLVVRPQLFVTFALLACVPVYAAYSLVVIDRVDPAGA